MTESLGNESYLRPQHEYTRPSDTLWIDGSVPLESVTGYDNEELLESLPLGEVISLELVPEPGNPADALAVALDVDGLRIGYLRRGMAASMHSVVVDANRQGYQVLAHAKVFRVRHGRMLKTKNGKVLRSELDPDGYSGYADLDLRGTWPENLSAWLAMPANVRGSEFFEFAWHKADRQSVLQEQLRAALDGQPHRIVGCELLLGTTEDGMAVDVYVDDIHLGTLRPQSRNEHAALIAHVRAGCRIGIAKLHQWPDNVELQVALPGFTERVIDDPDELAREHSGERFLWADERQARDDAQHAEWEDQWERAAKADQYQGKPTHEWSGPIDELKRAGEYEKALAILLPVIAAQAEADKILDRPTSGYYTEQAAIIYRKLKHYRGEIAVLEQHLAGRIPGDAPAGLVARLARARILEKKATT
ncbi:hypothetical protein [Rhodococcus sp. A14]|uniref:hypothetical protein n=1 Tax=Rhodococcus sp. A14 TaxID=1194106 RepID=UPI00141F410F|nr:hypothetical protein [Rhodococcus sp. A14]